MELVEYIRLFRKWFWLFLLAGFLGGGVSFVIRSRQAPVYQTETTLSIGGFIQSPDPEAGQIQIGFDLAQTYAQLVKTYDVLQATVDAGDLPMSPERLRNTISTRIISGTSLLVLSITHTDPVLAADMANGLAEQLILNSPTNLTPQQQSQIDLVNREIDTLVGQLEDARLQLEVLDDRLETEEATAEIERLTTQRNALVEQINQASSTIAQYSGTIANLQQRTNSLDIVERARVPTNPSGASVMTLTLLGAFVGMALAGGLVLVVEYLDDTLRTSEDTAQLLELPVLGTIIRFGRPNDGYAQRLITNHPPESAPSEGYRTLRTNLLYASEEESEGIFLVTSPGPEEGKSVTVSNLAVAMASAGLRVLLIDADLRRPKLHEIFDLPNDKGLTTLLFAAPANGTSEGGVGQTLDGTSNDLIDCLQRTSIPRLKVITSGFVPRNPTEILGSALMQRWLKTFKAASDIDIILIDTPPALVASDSSVLASIANAGVILVVEAGRTRRAAAQRVKEQFNHVGSDIKGVVLNGVNPRDEAYYGYSYYYTYYSQSSDDQRNNHRGLRRLLSRNGKKEAIR